MGTELEIALVFLAAFLWVVVTLSILSAIDRSERKARRQEKRANRAGNRRVEYRPVAAGTRPENAGRRHRPGRLRPH
ncbi:hypothetical protein ARTHROSP310_33300 [Arthrobacter sp. AD-310]